MNFLMRRYKNYQLDAAGRDEGYLSARELRRNVAKGKPIPQTVHLAGNGTWAYLDHMDLGDRTLVCHHAELVANDLTVRSLVHQPDVTTAISYMKIDDSRIETVTAAGVPDIAIRNVVNLASLTTDATYVKGENLPVLAQLEIPPLARIDGYRMIDCPHLEDDATLRHISLPYPKAGKDSVIDVATDGACYVMDYFKGTKQELLDDVRPDFCTARETIMKTEKQAVAQITQITQDTTAARQTTVAGYHQGYVMFNALQELLVDDKAKQYRLPNPADLLRDNADPQILIGMEVDRRRRNGGQPGPS